MDGLSIFADGVDEVRKAVRQNIHEGADVIKLYVTGEGLLRPGDAARGDDVLVRGDRRRGRRGAQAQPAGRGARPRQRRRQALRLGRRRRPRARDVRRRRGGRDDRRAQGRHLRRAGPRLPLGHPRRTARPAASPPELLAATEYQEEWELGCMAMDKLRKAGVRVVPGRRLRLRLVPPRPVREGHRAVRHRHGLLADGGDRRRDEARLPSCSGSSTSAARSRRASAPTSSSSTATRSRTSRSSRTARSSRW